MQETDQESEVSQLFRVFDIEGAGVIGWLEFGISHYHPVYYWFVWKLFSKQIMIQIYFHQIRRSLEVF